MAGGAADANPGATRRDPSINLWIGIDKLTAGDCCTAAPNLHLFPPRSVLGEVKVRF